MDYSFQDMVLWKSQFFSLIAPKTPCPADLLTILINFNFLTRAMTNTTSGFGLPVRDEKKKSNLLMLPSPKFETVHGTFHPHIWCGKIYSSSHSFKQPKAHYQYSFPLPFPKASSSSGMLCAKLCQGLFYQIYFFCITWVDIFPYSEHSFFVTIRSYNQSQNT